MAEGEGEEHGDGREDNMVLSFRESKSFEDSAKRAICIGERVSRVSRVSACPAEPAVDFVRLEMRLEGEMVVGMAEEAAF